MNLPALQRGAKLCGPDDQIARSAAERGHVNRGNEIRTIKLCKQLLRAVARS